MKDFCVIIQGPSVNVQEQKKSWQNYDIIWSTWDGEQNKYDSEDIVLFNEIPKFSGIQNIVLQQKSTIEGIKKAKYLNYKRVLKWRSDLLPTNPNKLVATFKKDSVNFLAWHNTGRYFIDYFMEGDIDDIYKIWDFDKIVDKFPEKIITENFFEKKISKFNFILEDLNSDNEIFWVKRNIFLSSLNKDIVYS
jgi:hypothetical protein